MDTRKRVIACLASTLIAIWAASGRAVLSGQSGPPRAVPQVFGLPNESTVTETSRTIYLQLGDSRVGIDKAWGGTIREIWFQGRNFVNNRDGGRLIGVSLYDANGAYYGTDIGNRLWGWNPTPSDKYDHANSLLDASFSDGVLYVKARNLEWNPDNKGGSRRAGVSSDVVVESWFELWAANPVVLRVKYRITHDGGDSHAAAGHEYPFVYVRKEFPTFVGYAGGSPWTNGEVEMGTPPTLPASAHTAASESWGGFVDANGIGLILWAPQAYQGLTYWFAEDNSGEENSTNYLVPDVMLPDIGPGFAHESEVYVLVGRSQDARAQIYALQQSRRFADVLPPLGTVDGPVRNETISGDTDIGGWAIDNGGMVASVEVALDGRSLGRATYGLPRPDVQKEYAGVPGSLNSGFRFSLNTRQLTNGTHTVDVHATDTAGMSAPLFFSPVTVTVQNGSAATNRHVGARLQFRPATRPESKPLGRRLTR